jgi:hypothetical protein
LAVEKDWIASLIDLFPRREKYSSSSFFFAVSAFCASRHVPRIPNMERLRRNVFDRCLLEVAQKRLIEFKVKCLILFHGVFG